MLRNDRAACVVQRDRLLEEANRVLSETKNEVDPYGRGTAGSVLPPEGASIRVCVYRAYPDGRDLATPQDIIERLDQYKVLANSGQVSLPALNKFGLDSFARGARSNRTNRNEQDPELPITTVIHSGGVFVSMARLPFRQEEHHLAESGKQAVQCVLAESVCSLAMALLRCAFRWFQAFGCYAALHANVSFSAQSERGHYIVTNSVELRGRHTAVFGPASPHLTADFTPPWPAASECDRISEDATRRYISSFNVRDSHVAKAIIERAKELVVTRFDD